MQSFELWRRYVKVRRLPKDGGNRHQFLSIGDSGLCLAWRVLERRWNSRRIRQAQAERQSAARLATKATRALLNSAIESRARQRALEDADHFCGLHLQRIAHCAWLRYLEIRAQDANLRRNYLKAWY